MPSRDTIKITSLAFLLALAKGCAAPMPTGDLGRGESNMLTDEILPFHGVKMGERRGELTANFDMTPEEKELRDRAWRYIKAPHADDWFTNIFVELQRNRFISKHDNVYYGQMYYQILRSEKYRSSHTRFKRLQSDIRADRMLLEPFHTSACKVIKADSERQRALQAMKRPSADLQLNTKIRLEENQSVIVMVRRALKMRVHAYQYALENLHVETPSNYAYPVQGELKLLQDMMNYLDESSKCQLPRDYSAVMNEIPSRYDPNRGDMTYSTQQLLPGSGEIPSRYSRRKRKPSIPETGTNGGYVIDERGRKVWVNKDQNNILK